MKLGILETMYAPYPEAAKRLGRAVVIRLREATTLVSGTLCHLSPRNAFVSNDDGCGSLDVRLIPLAEIAEIADQSFQAVKRSAARATRPK